MTWHFKQNGFYLIGIIEHLSEEAITFRTNQAKSVMDIKSISTVVYKEE